MKKLLFILIIAAIGCSKIEIKNDITKPGIDNPDLDKPKPFKTDLLIFSKDKLPSKGVSIGNSITMHPVTSFWWGRWGMAASSRDKDYVHQLELLVKAKNPTFTLTAVGNVGWETGHVGYDYSRWETNLPLDTDLVIIILGDNTLDLTGYENSCKKMLTYVRTRLPNATIIVTDNWYYSQPRATAMKNAAAQVPNVKYLSIASTRNASTEAGLGAVVMGDDDLEHKITHAGVSTHPGDKGMLAIAERLFKSILEHNKGSLGLTINGIDIERPENESSHTLNENDSVKLTSINMLVNINLGGVSVVKDSVSDTLVFNKLITKQYIDSIGASIWNCNLK